MEAFVIQTNGVSSSGKNTRSMSMNTETIASTSKKIKIFRNQSFLEKAQQGIAEFMVMTKQSIGSYWESSQSTAVGTGLSIVEQELLLPYVLDIPAEDRGFRLAMREFYIKMNTSVPYKDGIELEIGLTSDNDKPLSKSNLPIKVLDYLKYRHAKGHPQVALSRELAAGNQIIKFYIFDKSATQVSDKKLVDIRDEAMQIYFKHKADAKKVAQFLALLGLDPRDIGVGQSREIGDDLRQQELRTQAEKNPADVIKVDKLDSFEERYAIKIMVDTGVLNLYGSRYVIASNGEAFGNDIDEAISRLKNPVEKELIVALKSTAQEALKAGRKGKSPLINLEK